MIKTIKKLWHYFTTYEKIWLSTLCVSGIALAIIYPDNPDSATWLQIVQIITLIGGCSCELLLSKRSKWAFVVSFFLYDLTQTVVYISVGLYISALFEVLFWMPMVWISFFCWNKIMSKENDSGTPVKAINLKRDLLIFSVILAVSVAVGILFTQIGVLAEGMPDWWILDALANTFSVCNGLFLLLRFREQWLPWFGVCICEAVLWILSGQYIMLILSLGYLTNSTYGWIMWTKYVKKHKNEEPQEITSQV